MNVPNDPCPHRLQYLRLTLLLSAATAAGGFRVLGQSEAPEKDAAVGSTETLRHAAKGRFLAGAAVMSRQPQDPKLAALVAKQFHCLTGENEFKRRSLQPQPCKFDFAAAGRIIEFADQHDMKVVGHTRCWHSQAPAWMFRGPDGKPLPREETVRNLKAHIDAVVGHFKGKMIGWEVVNEAISDARDPYLRDTPARRAIGDAYIAQAFEFAHAADPDAELYYKDYGNENPGKPREDDPPDPQAQS